MILPPSNQSSYTEIWSGDPALVQPPPEPKGASKAALKEYKAALEEHQRKVKLAGESGNWSALLIPGQQPTRFVVRPLSGQAYREIVSRLLLTDPNSEKRLTQITMPAVVFRCCIEKIENGGYDQEIQRYPHEAFGSIVSVDVANYLDGIDPTIVSEIGRRIYDRGTQAPSPL